MTLIEAIVSLLVLWLVIEMLAGIHWPSGYVGKPWRGQQRELVVTRLYRLLRR